MKKFLIFQINYSIFLGKDNVDVSGINNHTTLLSNEKYRVSLHEQPNPARDTAGEWTWVCSDGLRFAPSHARVLPL